MANRCPDVGRFLVAEGFFQAHLELAAVEATGVTAQEPFYADDGIGLGRLDEGVRTVRKRQKAGTWLAAGRPANRSWRRVGGGPVEEPLAVVVQVEDELTVLVRVPGVADRGGLLATESASGAVNDGAKGVKTRI